MDRRPEDCDFRVPAAAAEDGAATCKLLGRLLGAADPALARVERDACEACCRSLRDAQAVNPVMASLLYHAATKIIRSGGHAECNLDRAQELRACATDQLGLILAEFPEQAFPPLRREPCRGEPESSSPRCSAQAKLTWAVGVMTAPRQKPTLERTLTSLANAGFTSIQIFAEPGSWLPAPSHHWRATLHSSRLGTLLNCYQALATMLAQSPAAEALAIFQDDIEVAGGLRAWCEEQFWPHGAGVVSLFTPRLHASQSRGWRLLSPGYQRVCGGQAIVFRRDVLQEFLADALVIQRLAARTHNNDAVIAGWVARRGGAVAYHTPSLVQHIGEISSIYRGGPDRRNVAHAVSAVDQIASWNPLGGKRAALGLVGWDVPTGIGYQNRDLAVHLDLDRWLVPAHFRLPTLSGPPGGPRREVIPTPPDDRNLSQRLRGLDWVLFVEAPPWENLVRVAAHSGLGVACVANWEWLQPELAWLPLVDLMICPTAHTALVLNDWKKRYGFAWDLLPVPWPVDADRFRFRPRDVCRRFLYVHGWGGAQLRDLQGSLLHYTRKGFELMVAAARSAPQLSFLVYSQKPISERLPPNMELRTGPARNIDLYDAGDVCVQPSHFEGLGLPLLECQAAGLPLVTTGAPPMNEYQPLRTIPTLGTKTVCLAGNPIPSQVMEPLALAQTLEELVGCDIHEASLQAREYVVHNHSWNRAVELLRGAMVTR